MTFRHDGSGLAVKSIPLFFIIITVASIVAGILWGGVSDRYTLLYDDIDPAMYLIVMVLVSWVMMTILLSLATIKVPMEFIIGYCFISIICDLLFMVVYVSTVDGSILRTSVVMYEAALTLVFAGRIFLRRVTQ